MTSDPRVSILVAEDEADHRNLLRDLVEGAGYSVTVAQNGSEAISFAGMNRFDVALLDIQLPNASGLEVLRYLREHSPSTKAIMITGFGDLKNAMEAREHGAVDFITKPYKSEDILATIERVLKS